MGTTQQRMESAGLAQVPERILDEAYPEIAQALRKRTATILNHWREHSALDRPEVNKMAIEEFHNEIGAILDKMADALASNDRRLWIALADVAPIHGYHRFEQAYSIAELLNEERILHRVILEEILGEMGRSLRPDETVALHTAIDFMFQQGVLALWQKQQQKLMAASNVKLKYLSFLSHDLKNNLLVLRLRLDLIKKQAESHPAFHEFRDSLDAANELIVQTVAGAEQVVDYQVIRKAGVRPDIEPVSVLDAVQPILDVSKTYADLKNVRFDVRIRDDVVLRTDRKLLTLILQNIINNAVKHSRDGGGTVTLDAEHDSEHGTWTLSVADDGPGIDEQTRSAILDAFERGEELGAPGLGLGLAISFQAAQLLNARVGIDSRPEGGTVFRLTLRDQGVAL